jgi:hypothetical protein
MTTASGLLIREPPLVVLPSLAKAIGLHPALMLQQIHFRSLDSRDDGWVQKSRREWVLDFPFWSVPTIKRALAELHDRGLIEAEYVHTAQGREPRYRVLHAAVDALGGVGANSSDGSDASAPMGRGKSVRCRSFKGREKNAEGKDSTESSPSPKKTTAAQLSSSSSRLAARRADPAVVALCDLLAVRMLANDERANVAPASVAWRDPMRLLLDRDGRPADEVERVIGWCQADEFWRSNILSPAALRRQFARLLLAARRDDGPDGAGVSHGGRAPRGGGDLDERQRRLRDLAAAERDTIEGTAIEETS